MTIFKELKASLEDAIRCEAERKRLNQRFFKVDKEAFNALNKRLRAPANDNPALRKLLSTTPPWE